MVYIITRDIAEGWEKGKVFSEKCLADTICHQSSHILVPTLIGMWRLLGWIKPESRKLKVKSIKGK